MSLVFVSFLHSNPRWRRSQPKIVLVCPISALFRKFVWHGRQDFWEFPVCFVCSEWWFKNRKSPFKFFSFPNWTNRWILFRSLRKVARASSPWGLSQRYSPRRGVRDAIEKRKHRDKCNKIFKGLRLIRVWYPFLTTARNKKPTSNEPQDTPTVTLFQ